MVKALPTALSKARDRSRARRLSSIVAFAKPSGKLFENPHREKLSPRAAGCLLVANLASSPRLVDVPHLLKHSWRAESFVHGTHDSQGKEAVWLAGREGSVVSRAPWAGFFQPSSTWKISRKSRGRGLGTGTRRSAMLFRRSWVLSNRWAQAVRSDQMGS